MAEKEAVGDMSAWSGMLKDLFRQIDDGSITREMLKAFLGHRNPFAVEYITIVDDGKKRTSELIAELRKINPVSVYHESEVDKEFPAPSKATSRKFLLTQEADEDLKNMSANDLDREGVIGITLRERLLYELGYFEKTGQYLDEKTITLCAGSRYSDGYVPGVDRSSGKIFIYWYFPDRRNDNLRSRREVSLKEESRFAGFFRVELSTSDILSSHWSFWKFPADPIPELCIFSYQ